MMINITVALTAHHVALIPLNILNHDNRIYLQLPPEFCALHTILIIYFGTVLMFLFAAESINLYFKIVTIFSGINDYVNKATLTAWSKKHNSTVIITIITIIQ